MLSSFDVQSHTYTTACILRPSKSASVVSSTKVIPPSYKEIAAEKLVVEKTLYLAEKRSQKLGLDAQPNSQSIG